MNNENHNEHASHPTDSTYIKIAVILAVITALEVAIFYIDGIPDMVFFTILICMSIVKFAIVAMYYMHLKFDESIFVWFFGGGILLASGVIIALMVLFNHDGQTGGATESEFDSIEGTRWSGSYMLRGNPPCEGVFEGVVELVLAVNGKEPLPISLEEREDIVGSPIVGAARLNVVMALQEDGTCGVTSGGPHEYNFNGELGEVSPSGSMDFALTQLSTESGSNIRFMASGTLKADGGIEGDLFTGRRAAYAWLDLEPELIAAATPTPAPTPELIVPQSLPSPVTPDQIDLSLHLTAETFDGFPRPQALAFDGEYIWVADSEENTVTKLDQDGQIMGKVSVGDGPRTILYAAEYIWVGNGRDGSITKIDPSDLATNTYPLGDGYTAPIDLAHDGELLWVVTSWGNAVYAMNMEGEVVNRIPIRGMHPSPWTIALQGEYLWVASLNLQEVQKFNRDGILVARYKVSDEPPSASGYEEMPGLGGQGPSGLAFDGESMWVGINWEGKLVQLSLEGEVLRQIVIGGWPGHLTFDGRYIWTAAWGSLTIMRIDVTTGETGFFPLDSPSSLVSTGDALWAASLFDKKLLKLVPSSPVKDE